MILGYDDWFYRCYEPIDTDSDEDILFKYEIYVSEYENAQIEAEEDERLWKNM